MFVVICVLYFKKKHPPAQTVACPGYHILALVESVKTKGRLLSFLLQLNPVSQGKPCKFSHRKARGKEVTISEPTSSAENRRLLRRAHGRCRASLKAAFSKGTRDNTESAVIQVTST